MAGIHMSPIPSLNYDCEAFGERVIRSVTANTRQDGIDLLREAAAIPIKPHIGTSINRYLNSEEVFLKQLGLVAASVCLLTR